MKATAAIFRALSLAVLAAAVFSAGYGGGCVRERSRADAGLDGTIAIAWGDGPPGPAFYGMRVFLEPAKAGLSVRAEIRIGPGDGMVHDCGEIGTAPTRAEAVQRFGRVTWRDDGVHVGEGSRDEFFLARDVVEAHR